jgi:hypothetical protein
VRFSKTGEGGPPQPQGQRAEEMTGVEEVMTGDAMNALESTRGDSIMSVGLIIGDSIMSVGLIIGDVKIGLLMSVGGIIGEVIIGDEVKDSSMWKKEEETLSKE